MVVFLEYQIVTSLLIKTADLKYICLKPKFEIENLGINGLYYAE